MRNEVLQLRRVCGTGGATCASRSVQPSPVTTVGHASISQIVVFVPCRSDLLHGSDPRAHGVVESWSWVTCNIKLQMAILNRQQS
eukprot:974025-Amphidinium_carterae.1